MKKIIFALFILAGLLFQHTLISAETIYTRYFESIDGDLRSDILQVYSVTALRGEKITLVVYGLEEGMAPAITALDPTGVTLVEDLNPNLEDVSLVQFNATVDGIYPFVVYRQTPVEGLVRIMLFEGDPIDATTSILDTVDPLLPSRAYLLAGERSEDDGEFSGQAIEFSVQSLPFEPVEGAEDEELPQPQFFASRATQQDTPELEERLAAVERSDWLNNTNIQLYTLNIRPVPENPTGIQQEVFREGDVEIPTLDQPLLPYDIVITVKPGIDPPIRLERPFCSGTLPLVGRTLIVQNVPGEAYVQLGTASGGDIVEIIGTDDTGNYVQISWDAALNGSGWIPFQEIFETGSPECVRVIPVEEDMETLDEAIQEVIDEIRARFAPQEVAEVPTPTPQPTLEFTPQPVISNLQLTNVVDNEYPVEGSTVNFTIALGNFSTTFIENAQVDIVLPVGLTFVQTSEHCLEGSVFPICILGDIPAGEVRGFLLYATVDPNTLGQTLTTIAETSSGGVLLQAPEDVTVIAPNTAPPILPSVDLSIAKTVNSAFPYEGDTITYTLTATNLGVDGAGAINVTDQLPTGITIVGHTASKGSYDTSTGIWDIGILQSGETATLAIQASINSGAYGITITNTANITAPDVNDSNTANNISSIDIFPCPPIIQNVPASDVPALINAINIANICTDTTTINLATSTYTLTAVDHVTITSFGSNYGNTGLPAITTPVIINGNGATVTRSGAAPTFRIMYIDTAGDVTLNNTIISNGAESSAAGILVAGNLLAMSGTSIESNNATSDGGGMVVFGGATATISSGAGVRNNSATGSSGGISATGTLIVENGGVVEFNSSPYGGGIACHACNTTIRAGGIVQNNTANDGAGINVNQGGTVTITGAGTFVRNNNATNQGGGISCDRNGNVNVTAGAIVENNTANFGGGIANISFPGFDNSAVNINGGIIRGNAATFSGGGIYNTFTNGTVTITGGSQIGQSGFPNTAANGAGIYSDSSSATAVTIIGSTVSFNNASNGGGGIWLDNGTLTVNSGSLIGNNIATTGSGGGIANNFGNTIINSSTLSGNSASNLNGGGLSNGGGSVSINYSTLFGNSAKNGGGIFAAGGTLGIVNSTLSGNSASTDGGGIATLSGTVTISNSTISGNSATILGGGFRSFASFTVKNSIVANNIGNDCTFIPGFINDLGDNLDTDGTCVIYGVNGNVTQVTPAALNLGPLANNGGATQTHSLIAPSSAIDAALDCTDTGGTTVGTDQRGVARPQGAACDIGAYEAQ